MADNLILRELSRYELGTFADIIRRNSILYPDNEAFVCGSERVSFRLFNERANCLTNGLQTMGIQKGDVIGILSCNRLEYAEVFGAAMKGGFVLAHYNPRLQAQELVHVINDSKARVVFLGPEFNEIVNSIQTQLRKIQSFFTFGNEGGPIMAYRELLNGHSSEEPEPNVTEEDPLTIFYTSGTTGIPRGGVYTHKRKMQNVMTKALDIGVEFGDRHLVVIPMFHVAGDSHVWPFFLMGGCNVIMPQLYFDPAETLRITVDERITDIHIVPTQLVALLDLPDIEQYDLHNLKRVWYAGSPMPTEVLKKGISRFGSIFIQGYGLTESGPHTTILKKAHHRYSDGVFEEEHLLASCGQPSMGVHMRIVDKEGNDVEIGEIGEIIVRSKRIMQEYWQKPDDTNEVIKDDWLYTGDMGYYDEKGFIYIADRKKDMIVTGGENVYPKEVEEVLNKHPSIKEAAVIGIPDSYWVEKVNALIVLKGDTQVTEEEIINFCRERIAHYKAPKAVEFVESLPKNPQGKIMKKEIRSKYWKK